MSGSKTILSLDETAFKQQIAQGITLVDFYADWCGPCRMLTPFLEKLAQEMEGKASIAKVDVEASPNIAAEYEVSSIPTLILFKDGAVVNRVVGLQSGQALSDLITQAL